MPTGMSTAGVRWIAFALAVTIAGCITIGSKFTKQQLEQLQLGMTGDQVLAIMGDPHQMTTQPASSGREMWSYTEADGLGRLKQASVVFEEGRVVQVVGMGISKSTMGRPAPFPGN